MIYVTGDTHGGLSCNKLNSKNFPEQKKLTKQDFLIVLGDFGLVWDKSKTEEWWLKWFNHKNFTTLWLDGNHENFDLLSTFPIEEKFGGKVTKITDSIYHLRRGEIYSINGKSFFVMGGAESVDKHYRKEGEGWWKQEMPNFSEMQYGLDNLEKNNWKVDYILTHCAPSSVQEDIFPRYKANELNSYLNFIYNNTTFERWYCGHYHCDIDYNYSKFRILYNIIEKI